MDELHKDELIQEFYENPETTGNAKALYDNIKEKGHTGITLKYIQNWLNNQEEKQVSTKYKQSGFYIPRYPRQEYQIDLFYFVELTVRVKTQKKMMLFQSKLLS